MRKALLITSFVQLILPTHASFRVPLARRTPIYSPSADVLSSSSLARGPDLTDDYGLRNEYNLAYTGILSVNGKLFTTHIDTGSSDLWFDTKDETIMDTVDTGVFASIRYV